MDPSVFDGFAKAVLKPIEAGTDMLSSAGRRWPLARRARGEQGQALVLLVLLLTGLLGIASLAIDIGYARVIRAKAQSAADAAALAGADVLPGGSATSIASEHGDHRRLHQRRLGHGDGQQPAAQWRPPGRRLLR